jgi:hypothetical protein
MPCESSWMTRSVEIVAEKGGTLRPENPFGDTPYAVTGADVDGVTVDGWNLLIETSFGQRISFARESSE